MTRRPLLGAVPSHFPPDESDTDSLFSGSSCSSADDEDVNHRVSPIWCNYRHLIEDRGFRLDTFRDVKQYYQQYWEDSHAKEPHAARDCLGYIRACSGPDDDELCKDAGLPENLFRGTCLQNGMKVVIKAVHHKSREYDIIRRLSSPPLRGQPMNHCIPVYDLIEVPGDSIAFIVMEEWSSQLVSDRPCRLHLFLDAMQQCIEHIVFMHDHNMAHLDISIRNLLTDDEGHYAYIDYERSRQYDGMPDPRIYDHHSTEDPPELENGGVSDPFKVDVWALGVLILRSCMLTGYHVPELMLLLRCMLHPNFEARYTAREALDAFNAMILNIEEARLNTPPSCET